MAAAQFIARLGAWEGYEVESEHEVQRCAPQRRTVKRSSVSKPRASTSKPMSTTLIRPANTLSV